MSSKKPAVSIIIVCYNYGRYLLDAIESARRQTFTDREIIVVDGGSTEAETRRLIDELSALSDLRVFTRETRCLVGDNRNYGISKARGEWICCLDADDILRPTYIEKILMRLALSGADLASASRFEFGEGSRVHRLKEQPILEDVLEENQFNSAAVFRKNLWLKVGGYVDFGLGAEHFYEDWHFWMRCLAAGAKASNLCDDALIGYRLHSSGSLSSQKGSVPELAAQRAFIQKAYQTFAQNLTDGVDRPSGNLNLNHIHERILAGGSSTLLVVPAINSVSYIQALEAYCDSEQIKRESLVICSTVGYLDREDRLGRVLDDLTPRHYECARTFPGTNPAEVLACLINAHRVTNVRFLGDALNKSDLDGLCVQFPEVAFDRVVSLPETTALAQSADVSDICIRNSGQASSNSEGCEIWLLGVRDEMGQAVELNAYETVPQGWQLMESEASFVGKALVSVGPASLQLSLPESFELFFLKHAWSGKVEVSCCGEKRVVDLYSDVSEIYQFSSHTKNA
jgi:hypothetical protein